jgi:hypothetical protein
LVDDQLISFKDFAACRQLLQRFIPLFFQEGSLLAWTGS